MLRRVRLNHIKYDYHKHSKVIVKRYFYKNLKYFYNLLKQFNSTFIVEFPAITTELP